MGAESYRIALLCSHDKTWRLRKELTALLIGQKQNDEAGGGLKKFMTKIYEREIKMIRDELKRRKLSDNNRK
jgi:hypothetical protein